jgi:hypothetical protein
MICSYLTADTCAHGVSVEESGDLAARR